MAENGIDPSGYHPKSIELYLGKKYHIIVTTGDSARESCPFLPGDARRHHWGLDDPAAVEGDEEERLAAFRKTFTEISEQVSTLSRIVRKIYDERSRE